MTKIAFNVSSVLKTSPTQEKKLHALPGIPFALLAFLLFILAGINALSSITETTSPLASLFPFLNSAEKNLLSIFIAAVFFLSALVLSAGLFSLQPGIACVVSLFGAYRGTVTKEGLNWINPLYTKRKLSLRARALNGLKLKVNDKMGNPIEIASVTIWHIQDSAKALFDIDNYEQYVSLQAETALRHVASTYAYDHLEEDSFSTSTITLRSDIEEVSAALKLELTERLRPAGVSIDDARLTHLTYAPEIAQAMLRRQQAEAIISARKKIVEGAVGMVSMAMEQLSRDGVVKLDEDKKAMMAANLMVVLCGESETQPIINAGTLEKS